MAGNPTAWFDIAGRNRAQRTFDEVNQGLGRIRKTGMDLRRVLNIGGGIGSIAGFAAMAKQAATLSAELLNTSDKLGLSTDFLQTWNYAADRFDITASTAATALQRFSRRIAEANQGSGELSKVIDELGISLRTANGALRPVEDILGDYADAVAQASSKSDQLRLAFKAFDSEGAALVSILRQGSDGLREFETSAREAGRIIDQSVARNLAEAQKKLEDFQQGMTIFSGNVVGAFMADNPDEQREAASGAAAGTLKFLRNTVGRYPFPTGYGPKGNPVYLSEVFDSMIKATQHRAQDQGPMYFPNRSSEVGAYQDYMRNQGKTNEFLRRIAENTDRLAKENPGATYAR